MPLSQKAFDIHLNSILECTSYSRKNEFRVAHALCEGCKRQACQVT